VIESGGADHVIEADPMIVASAAGHVTTTGETGLVIVTEGTHAGAVVVMTVQEIVVLIGKIAVILKSEVKC